MEGEETQSKYNSKEFISKPKLSNVNTLNIDSLTAREVEIKKYYAIHSTIIELSGLSQAGAPSVF